MSQKPHLLNLEEGIQRYILNKVRHDSFRSILNFGLVSKGCRKLAVWFIYRDIVLTDKIRDAERNEWLTKHLLDPCDEIVTPNVRKIIISSEKGTTLAESVASERSVYHERGLTILVGEKLKGDVIEGRTLARILENVKGLQFLDWEANQKIPRSVLKRIEYLHPNAKLSVQTKIHSYDGIAEPQIDFSLLLSPLLYHIESKSDWGDISLFTRGPRSLHLQFLAEPHGGARHDDKKAVWERRRSELAPEIVSNVELLQELYIASFDHSLNTLFPAICEHSGSLEKLGLHTGKWATDERRRRDVLTAAQIVTLGHFPRLTNLSLDITFRDLLHPGKSTIVTGLTRGRGIANIRLLVELPWAENYFSEEYGYDGTLPAMKRDKVQEKAMDLCWHLRFLPMKRLDISLSRFVDLGQGDGYLVYDTVRMEEMKNDESGRNVTASLSWLDREYSSFLESEYLDRKYF